MKKIFSLLLLSVFSTFAFAQSWQDTVSMIDKMFERFKPANPGCQVAISRNGQVIFSKAWGMADLEHAVPLTTESIIEAGSVSKQFTAAAILLLEQQGKLSLNDDVRKHLPEMPDYGTPVTLRHMMQHTSGLKDWGSVASIAGWPRSTKTYNNNDALYITSRQKTLNNVPGAEYIYSNSNYNLFAVIVERVSGLSLAEFTRKNIFEPAGMKHTEWRDNYKKLVPGRAFAYSRNGSTYYTEMPNEYVYGNGGLLTTAEDLLSWNNYYLNGKLGSPSLLSRQLESAPFNNGNANHYGAGLQIDSARGRKLITHSGATAGYRANLDFFPDLGLSIAILCNSTDVDQGPNPANELRNLLVKDISANRQNASPATAFNVSQKSLDAYTGWYWSQRNGLSVKLFLRDGKLANNRGGNLIPLSENTFQLGGNRVQIITTNPRHLLLINPVDTVRLVAVDSGVVDEKTIKDYVGTYYSDEAEAGFEVIVKNGQLTLHRDPKTDFRLNPTIKDGFESPAGSIYFERDNKKQVTTMKIYVGRARNVAFKKIK
jgi:CubicO group peptidase (beta-lactamase class C family)